MSRTTKQAEIQQRRATIAANLVSGISLTQIAERLEISKATASSDLKAILAELRDKRLADADGYVTIQYARIERLINALWPKAIGGDLMAVDKVTKLLERQAKLLGLDAPAKAEQTHRFVEMSDEDLARWLEEHADEALAE